MTIARLQKIVPVPVRHQSLDIDWAGVEKRLGFELPSDYKALVATYGLGSFDDFLWVFHPSTSNSNLLLEEQISRQSAVLRALGPNETVPFPIHPAANGLVPWGLTDNGDICYWLTIGPADRWPTIVNESRAPRWERYDCGVVEFLCRVYERDIVSSILPDDFPSDDPHFTPLN